MQRERLVAPLLTVAGLGSVALAAWLLVQGREVEDRGVELRYVEGPAIVVPIPVVPPAPAPSMTCLPDVFALRAANQRPVICSGNPDTCVAFGDDGTPEVVSEVDDVPDPSAIERTAANKICLEGTETCTAIGPNLAAALDRAQQGVSHATADLAGVVVIDDLWNVARDRVITPVAPDTSKHQQEVFGPMHSTTVEVIGTHLLAHFADCAGPCWRAEVIDATGRRITHDLDGGGEIRPLGDKHFVHYTQHATVQVFDLAGKLVAGESLGTFGAIESPLAVIDTDRFAVIVPTHGAGGSMLRTYRFDPDSAFLHVESERFMPECRR